MLKGKKIVLGITGSIAAYKACQIIRLLVKAGAEVHPRETVVQAVVGGCDAVEHRFHLGPFHLWPIRYGDLLLLSLQLSGGDYFYRLLAVTSHWAHRPSPWPLFLTHVL